MRQRWNIIRDHPITAGLAYYAAWCVYEVLMNLTDPVTGLVRGLSVGWMGALIFAAGRWLWQARQTDTLQHDD